MNALQKIASHTWAMVAEMGPYLLIGFTIAVFLHKLLRANWVERLMGRRHLSSVVWGSVVGVPMPLCSCGVIPVTVSLRNKGASKGAAVSFLTSTPQTGVDSFLATYAMLGPVFAVYKLVVAFVSGILVGLATDLLDKPAPASSPPQSPSSAPTPQSEKIQTWPESFRYGFLTLPRDLSSALFLGFLFAGLISALAPADLLANLPGGALTAILIATAISVPFYICSTGSIPLALALVHSGLPISAALVLLIAGPAINIATITSMRKVLGTRSTLVYVSGVVLATWLAAACYHLFLDTGTLGQHGMTHAMDLPLWKHLGGALLLALLLLPRLAPLFPSTAQRPEPMTQNPASRHTLAIEGMNCSHCENSVREGLSSLDATEEVLRVDRDSGTAVIQAARLDEAAIREKLAALGFDYQGLK